MTAIFPTFFRNLLYNSLDKVAPLDPNTNLMVGKSLHWVYFRSHAVFTDSEDSRYLAIKTVSDLLGRPGWSPPIAPNSATAVVGTTAAGSSSYCIANNKFNMGGGWVTSTVTAAALVLEGSYTAGDTVTDPIVYITDSPFQGGVVMRPTDGLIARPVPALANNRSLFSWPNWATGMTGVIPVEGSVAVTMGAPDFEAAYTHHAWLYPQRINMIANPSFDTLSGTNHWRTSGALTKQPGTKLAPVAPGGEAQNLHYGRVTGTAPLVLESNTFPLYHRGIVKDQWTIQAMVRGTGILRVGLVGWDPTFVAAGADWGDMADYVEEWPLSPGSYTHVYALRHSYESTTGLVRFECSGGTMEIDNVLCEADWLRGWRYFDGDSTFGARDDDSWYGGENRHGATYSCYYNHRRAVIGRLFAWDIEADDFTITDEEVEAQGFIYKWVPAGVRVAAHLDVLWPDDIQEAVPDVAGTPVTPRNDGTNGGVSNPWAPYQYLNAPAGRVQTPDAADLNISTDVVWVWKVRRTDPWPSIAYFMSKNGAGSTLSWAHNYGNTRQIDTNYSTTVGTGAGGFASSPDLVPDPLPANVMPEDVDSYFAIYYEQNVSGATKGRALVSEDGVTWTPVGNLLTKTPAYATIFDSANPITIGQDYQGNNPFPGKIYWAEQRTGINPNGGTLVWRFDATEYPGSGTSYTDPRGRAWTLSSAAAIGR